jgi:AmmeMemoRadiSam system protein B
MTKPKLRNIEIHVVNQGGQQGVLLRDPLQISDRALFLPVSLAPLLELCDGTRDEAALRASLAVRAGVQVGAATLEQVLEQLDEALLLDNDHYASVYSRALNDFRTAGTRAPTSAGRSYPEDAEELRAKLGGYVDNHLEGQQLPGEEHPDIRGLVSPHIDYQRGGPVYAGVWARAAEALRQAELVIIFGTDHIGGAAITLTHQRYATPLGVLPPANTIIDALALALGPDQVFARELNHRSEHSIELAAVWLQYMLGDGECELLPVLCGGFEGFMDSEASPCDAPYLDRALAILKEVAASVRTVVIAAGDLAHVGPAFGDRRGLDMFEKARLRSVDEELMSAICAGDREVFWRRIQGERDRWRVCGLPPIYLALCLLGQTEGLVTGYAQCPADQQGLSYVSICGILLS